MYLIQAIHIIYYRGLFTQLVRKLINFFSKLIVIAGFILIAKIIAIILQVCLLTRAIFAMLLEISCLD